MRKGIIFVLALLVVFVAKAQQDLEPHYSHYSFNKSLFNPAFTGVGKAINLNMLYRKQWVNFPGSPVTGLLNGSAQITKQNMGIGGTIWYDQLGSPSVKTLNINALYAYHITLKNEAIMSFGLSAGIKQSSVDQSQVNAVDKSDEVLYGANRSPIIPDFAFGMAYTKGNFYSGFSISHLNQSKFRYTASQESKLLRHYYLTAGYKYDIDPYFSLKPSILLRAVNTSVPLQMDANILVDYTGSVWGGMGYRSGDAVSFLIGTQLDKLGMGVKEVIRIGYAFEWSISRVPKFNNGTHEIFLSYEFKKKEKIHTPMFMKIE